MRKVLRCSLFVLWTILTCGQHSAAHEYFIKVKPLSSVELDYNGQQSHYLLDWIQENNIESISHAFTLPDEQLQKVYLLKSPSPLNFEQFDYIRYDQIEYIEPVPTYELFLTPNDLQTNQWNLQAIKAELAWDISTGSNQVKIAMVDDAVRLSHEDLAPVIWTNPNEIAGNNIDDDANGYVDDVNGWDAANNDNNPNPLNPTNSSFTHGTHCAGIAAASTDNSKGIASISHNVSLIPVKIADDFSQSLTGAYLGVEYAMAIGADIISMSWGGYYQSSTYQLLFTVARQNGIVCIAAAGNSNTTIPMYPASYDGVISVGATQQGDIRSGFSNYGPTIDVMAPGSGIYSSLAGSNSSYGNLSGTSMACPLVSGLAALMLSYDNSLTPALLESCLKSSCDNIDALNPGYAGNLGAGRINALSALQCLATSPLANFTADLMSICPGQSVQFTNMTSGIAPISYQWSFPGGTPSASTLPHPSVQYSSAGVYNVMLTATNSLGNDVITKTGYITVSNPTATISGNATIYAGSTAYLKVDFTGNPPFWFSYTDGTNTYTKSNINSSPYYFGVSPLQTSIYTLTAANDSFCGADLAGSGSVTIVQSSGNAGGGSYCEYLNYYGSSLSDLFRYSIIDSLNEVIYNFGYGADLNPIVTKTTINGQPLWSKKYNNERISHPLLTDDGTIVYASSPNGNDYQLTRINSDGAVLYSKTIGSSTTDRNPFLCKSIGQTYFLGGWISGSGGDDFWLMRVDSLFNILWSKQFSSSLDEQCRSIIPNGNGGCYFVGEEISAGNYVNGFLGEVDPSGTVLMTKIAQNSVPNMVSNPTSIKKTTDGGLVMGGFFRTLSGSQFDGYILKIDNTFSNVEWTSTFASPSSGNDQVYNELHLDGENNSYLSASTQMGGTNIGTVVKYNSSGTFQWAKAFPNMWGVINLKKHPFADDRFILTSAIQNHPGTFGSWDGVSAVVDTNLSFCLGNTVTPILGSQNWVIGNWSPTITNRSVSVSSATITSTDQVLNFDTLCPYSCPVSSPSCTSSGSFVKSYAAPINYWSGMSTRITASQNGGYISNISSSANGTRQQTLVKINEFGDMEWTKECQAADELIGGGIMEIENGSIMFSGVFISGNSGDAHLTKTDPLGNIIWTKSYQSPNGMYLRNFVRTYDGNYILYGSINTGIPDHESFILKVNSNGNILSAKRFHYTDTIQAAINDVKETLDSGLIIASWYTKDIPLQPQGGSSIQVFKTDKYGNVEWTKLYQTNILYNHHSSPQSILPVDGGYVLTGYTEAFSNGSYDILVMKLDLLGNIIWEKIIESPGYDVGTKILEKTNGNYLLTGIFNDTTVTVGNDICTVELDTAGNIVTAKVINALNEADSPSDMILQEENMITITGRTRSIGISQNNILIAKTNCQGQWCNERDINFSVANTSFNVLDITLSRVNQTVSYGTNINTITSDSLVSTSACEIRSLDSCMIQSVFASSDSIVCIHDTVFFTNLSAGVSQYQWLIDGQPFSNTKHSYYIFETDGTYAITLIIDSAHCVSSSSKLVKVNTTPTITISSDTSTCDTDSLLLYVIGGAQYNWFPSTNLSCTDCPTPILFPTQTGTYFVQVTDSNNCVITDSVIVTAKCCINGSPGPIADFSTDTLFYCLADTVNFDNLSHAGSGALHHWEFGSFAYPTSYDGSNPDDIIFNQSGNMNVLLVVSDSCGVDSIQKSIAIFPPPFADAGNDITVCAEDTSTFQLGGEPLTYTSYEWKPFVYLSSNNISNPISNTSTSIEYYLIINDKTTGCVSSDSIQITINPLPALIVSTDTTITLGEDIQLTACCGENYNWTPSHYLSDSTIYNPIAMPNESITYYLKVENEFGCTAYDSVHITVWKADVYVPNIISPNGDELNEYFVIKGIYEPFQLTLYNRWGEEIYLQANYQNDWNADGISDGIYFYTIETESNTMYKGWVQVLR